MKTYIGYGTEFLKRFIIAVILFFIIIVFQNCSDVKFSDGNSAKPNQAIVDDQVPDGSGIDIDDNSSDDPGGGGSNPEDPGIEPDDLVGLIGGHFDLDTSSEVYPLDDGETDGHVHEYDNKYDVVEIDFFNLLSSKLDSIDDLIGTNQSFHLVITNAELSPGVNIEINGEMINGLDYQGQFRSQLSANIPHKVYSIGSQSPGAIELKSLKVTFDDLFIGMAGLIPTQTSCVVGNDRGQNGEYRNGAFTIQAIQTDQFNINADTMSASLNAGLLWEATIFWHKKDAGCYE